MHSLVKVTKFNMSLLNNRKNLAEESEMLQNYIHKIKPSFFVNHN